MLVEQDKPDEALVALQRAVTIIEKSQGPRHPLISNPLVNIGNLLKDLGKPDEASTYYRRALLIDEEVLGPTHPHVAQPLVGLTELALQHGDFDTARRYAERVVSVYESGQVPVELAWGHFLLARALWSEPAKRSRARELAEQAREVHIEHREAYAGELAQIEGWLAEHDPVTDGD